MHKLFVSFIAVSLLITSMFAEEKKNSFAEVGLTFSGLAIGYWQNDFGVRVNGYYFSDNTQELQFNLGYAFSDKNRLQQSVNILTSWFVGKDPGAEYRYAATGIAYAVNYYGFFLEIGVAVPWKDELGNLKNDFIIPCSTVGYIYQFRSL